MQLSMPISYAGGFEESARQVADLEKAGLDLAWVAEAYGYDGVSFMGYLAAKTERVQIGSGILPLYTRTPTLLAMTAAGVDALSGGRCVLGLGASGPQVIEGFHGVVYDKPLARTREIVKICRDVWAREAPLTNPGPMYPIPVPEGQGTGLGKPLKIIGHPVRARIPIYVASLGEKNVALTAEIADGWLPVFFVPEKARDVFGVSLDAGAAKRSPDLGPLEISAGGLVCITDDDAQAESARDLSRAMAALYIGGMGARGRNFYNALVTRYGYEKEAAEIQDLYLSGKKQEAMAKVPAELLEKTSLCGSEGYIKERIAAYKEAGVTNLSITPFSPNPVEVVEKLKAWVD
ncbi:MAG TPA: LLM class F420-dependent oxidoreductase [Acidimicrobiales bacterium]|jgi:F420-dependent oxidoreductase-like protein|nr:LLM class F420-dependent oxidoreductase [Acidimicrobiales bacterium]